MSPSICIGLFKCFISSSAKVVFPAPGCREWENKANTTKVETCDLLEVYSLHDRNELKRDSSIKWNILQPSDAMNTNAEDVNFMDISNMGDSESEEEIEIIEEETQNTVVTDCFGETVDIDDI